VHYLLAHHERSGVVLCGDQAGNIAAFDGRGRAGRGGRVGVGKAAIEFTAQVPAEASLTLLAAMRGVHGSQAVTLAAVRGVGDHRVPETLAEGAPPSKASDACSGSGGGDWDGVELVTGGRDGRLCTFALRPAHQPHAHETRREEPQPREQQVVTAAVTTAAVALVAEGIAGTSADTAVVEMPAPAIGKQPAGARGGHDKKAAKAAAAAAIRAGLAEAARAASLAPFRFDCVAKQQLPGITAVEALQWGRGGEGGSFSRGDGGERESLTLAAGFRETEFVVHSLVNQCELLRVNCGGWHRPCSLLLDDSYRGRGGGGGGGAGGGGLTFAYCKGGELTVMRRLPSASGGGDSGSGGSRSPNWNMRMLNVWSHGCVLYAFQPQIFGVLNPKP
jgi:hypothetical protein